MLQTVANPSTCGLHLVLLLLHVHCCSCGYVSLMLQFMHVAVAAYTLVVAALHAL